MPACSVLLRHMGAAEDPFMDCAAPPALAPSIPPPPQDLIRSLILAFSAWGRSSSAESDTATSGGGSGGALPRHQGRIPHALCRAVVAALGVWNRTNIS